MRSLLIFTILSTVFSVSLGAQKGLKKSWAESGLVPKNAKILEVTPNKVFYQTANDQFWMKMIHLDSKVVTIKSRFKSKDLKTLHGKYTERYDNGELWITGNHLDGNPVGRWIFYHPNGAVAKEVSYNKDAKMNGWLKEYDEEGNLLKASEYKNDRLNGTTLTLTPEADTISICTYINNRLQGCNVEFEEIEFQNVEDSRIASPDCELKVEESSRIACANNHLIDLIMESWTTPKNVLEEGAYGSLLFDLQIDANGNLEDIKVLRGVSNSCTAAVLPQIERLHTWRPKKVNGEPVPSVQRIQFDLTAVLDIRNTHNQQFGRIVQRKLEGRVSVIN